MFYFVSRRVSCAAIFVWSASILLCTMPGPVSAIPIEARLAEIIGANHQTTERACRLSSCRNAALNNPQQGPAPSSLAPAVPVVSATPDGSTTTIPETPETPQKIDPPAFVTAPKPAPEGSSDTSTDPDRTPPVTNVSQTSGAPGRVSNIPLILTWVMTCSVGALFAML